MGRLEQLRALHDACRVSTQAGPVRYVVTGEPGVGRTALLGAFARASRERGSATVALVCRRQDRHTPAALVGQLAGALAGRLAPGSPQEARLRHARDRLRTPDARPEPDPGLLAAVGGAVAALTSGAPLVLTVDDADWADAGSLAFLQRVVEVCAQHPVVLAVSLRLGEPPEAPAELAELLLDADQAALSGLSERETALLLRTVLPRGPAAGLAAACHRLTAGNPFLLGELAGWMREHPHEARDPARLETAVLPAVAGLMTGRAGRLDPAAARLAGTIAVAQTHGSADTPLVARLSGVELTGTLAALDLLVRMRLVEDDNALRLRHPLLRNALTGGMTLMARNAAHLATAAYLYERQAPAEWIADHLVASTVPPEGAWAAGVLRRAAGSARAAGDDARALRCLRLAVQTASGAEHLRAALELADVHICIDPAAGLGSAVAMLARATDDTTRRRLLGRISDALYGVGPAGNGQRVLDRVAAVVEGTGFHGWPRLHDVVSRLFESPPASTAKLVEDLPALPPPPDGHTPATATATGTGTGTGTGHVPAGGGELHAAATAVGAFCHWLVDEDPRESVRRARWALGRDIDELDLQPPALPAALTVLAEAGRHAEAAAQARRLGAAAHGRPEPRRTALLLARARIALAEGGLPAAQRLLAEALETTAVRGAHPHDPLLVSAVGLLADTLLSRGDAPGAEALLRRHRQLGELPAGWYYRSVLLARARLWAAAGDLPAAGRDLAELRARGEEAGLRATGTVAWRMHGVQLLDQVGRAEEARRLALEQLRYAEATESAYERGRALRVLGGVSGGAEGERLLREAVELLETVPGPYDLAHALGDLGCLLTALDRPREAVAALTRAARLAERCGAGALAARVRQQLLSTDERAPQYVSLRGVLALTPRERQILVDAMRGLTNKRIAATRQITRRTVELHLSSAYRKLGIGGRGDFPLAFRNPGLWTLLTDGTPVAR
ncbi:AAA family ATPase [Actinacidiphila sp. ITFR-21]|uniref:AAA family ATPase n=1 Tax=Actinacidiphila sp. ITFR-21 TaxID=3075199 RepID=UPI0028896C7C|nr:AAA family ATPase [Streptomyces sp. ITFR-21]WNI18832.1 AAA family ATPase [Streptomyces sp. ITFR-21]